jgi:hypothetical protein
MNKKIILNRFSSSLTCTTGVLVDAIDGLPICFTLERPWVMNKIDISCIPLGVYSCVPHEEDSYRILNVPGRTLINIEIGNKVQQSLGCIFVGLQFLKISGNQTILQSANAILELKARYKNGFILKVDGI